MKNNIKAVNRLPNNITSNFKAPAGQQNGVALVITIIVLLVLTIVGIASTDSNRIQAALTRNNQFRLEAFNTSYTEIDAQLDNINVNATIAAGVSPTISVLIDQESGSINSDDDTALIPVLAQHPKMTQKVTNSYLGQCLVIGSAIDVANQQRKCYVIGMESDAGYNDTAIRSDQAQNFKYETFAAN